VNCIRNTYRSTKQVPSVRAIGRKAHLRNGREFYKHYQGLAEACEDAHVPPPTSRLRVVKAALQQRRHNGDQKPAPPIARKLDSTSSPLAKEVAEVEESNAKDEAALELLELREKAGRKKAELQTRIQRIKDAKAARTMPYNDADFTKVMHEYYENHPNLQSRIQQLFSRLGWTMNFDRHLEELVAEQFGTLNRVATSWPEICRSMGLEADEMPVDADLPSTEWELIIEDLTLTADANDYARIDAKLRAFRPEFRCTTHMAALRHLEGPNFACPYSHTVWYLCPECRSPLNYDGTRFYCQSCFRRFTGL